MIDLSKRQFKLWTQQLLDWLEGKFTGVASSIDFTTVNNKIDAVGGKVDTVSNKIDNLPQPDLSSVAKQGTNPNATNTAILAAFGNIDFSTLAKQGSNANATLTAVLEALTGGDDPSPDIPEGVAERLAMILEFFGLPQALPQYTYATDQEVIDIVDDVYNDYFPND